MIHRIVMMGTGHFAEPTFEALLASSHPVVGLVTQPDRVVGAERGSTRQAGRSMKTMALEHGLPVLQPESINTLQGVAALRELSPDLLVVAAYGQILSKDVLAVPGQGGINVHASLLPKYRGAAPIAWAIYHGETRTGVTIIRMSVHLDAGDMLAQEAIDIGPEETAGQLEARLAPLGAKLALDVVARMADGSPLQGVQQDKSLATKAPKLKKEDGLIDWSRPAKDVCNQVRAMQPWPTAYTFLHGADHPPVRVIVNRAVAFPVRSKPAAATGSLFLDAHHPGSLLVNVGLEQGADKERSVVQVLELQPAGKRRMSAADFLRGHPIHPGDRFGPEPS
jgi:methionyl-tRNA formyltransferase